MSNDNNAAHGPAGDEPRFERDPARQINELRAENHWLCGNVERLTREYFILTRHLVELIETLRLSEEKNDEQEERIDELEDENDLLDFLITDLENSEETKLGRRLLGTGAVPPERH